MATKKTTNKATMRPKTATTSDVKSNRTTGRLSSGGVVAYTKGSRFKDAEVQAVVQRILKDS